MTPEELEQFTVRVIQDAMAQADAEQWRRRADQFEVAKPRVDEFHGQASRAQLSAAWQRCDAAARACRAKASFIEQTAREFEMDDELMGVLVGGDVQ